MRRVFAGAYEDNILFLASALTFDLLLAAVPFVILLLGVLGYVVAGDDPLVELHRVFNQLSPHAGSGADQLARVEALLVNVIESREQLSFYGIPLFVWFSTRFFGATRAALNEVFDTEEARPYWLGKALDLALVVAALALISANTMLTVRLGDLPFLGRLAASVSTFAIGVVLFFTVYILAPSRSVRFDTAVVAAAVASLGFEVAKVLYGLYLTNFVTVERLFSNANAIALLLFVLWLYYTTALFLLGGEVADTYDLMRRQREQRAILA